MATNSIAYRMRVYAARSVDATEATVLTPAGSAPHADEFKVASISGVSGYQPYLHDTIQGRRGRIDLKSRKLDIGTLTVTLIDKTTSTDNLTRWVSAFFGNSAGKPWPRLKVQIDECLDHTATSPTWSTYFTGEIIASKLVAKNQWAITIRERSETLKMRCFEGTPHSSITYAGVPTLLPVGFRRSDYGTQPASGTIAATARAGTGYTVSGEMILLLPMDATGVGHEGNIVTQNLLEALAPHGASESTFNLPSATSADWSAPSYTGKLRAVVTHGGNTGVYLVGSVAHFPMQRPGMPRHSAVHAITIKALQATETDFLAVPAAGTACTFQLFAEEEVSEARPLLIDDVDPVTLLEDLCAGKFGPIYREPMKLPTGKSYGDVFRAVATADLTAFKNIWPTARFVITKSESLLDWVEKNILIPYHMAMYLDASGQVNLVDLRMPEGTSGLDTITDTHVVEDQDPEWTHDPTSAVLRVDITRYSERLRLTNTIWQSSDYIPRLDGVAIEETKHPMESIFIGSIDYGDEAFKIDARGYRSMDGEQYEDGPRAEYLDAKLRELAAEMQRPFGFGVTTMTLVCRRVSPVTSLHAGSLVIVDVDVVPDPATWKRGGAQVCRVIEYTEDGPEIILKLVYLSSTAQLTAPSLAQPAQETGNTWTGVTCAVTVNASTQPVVVRYAITDTATGSAPSDTDPSWRFAVNATGRRLYLFSSQTITIRGIPPNKRCWVQGRTISPDDNLRLPSAWTLAGGTGYVDTASITAPNTLAATASDKTCLLTWTNGVSTLPVELLLATPTSDPRTRIALLPQGTTRYTVTDLDVSTQYRAEVRHVFGQHVSAGDTEDFTTTAASTTAPTPTTAFVLAAA